MTSNYEKRINKVHKEIEAHIKHGERAVFYSVDKPLLSIAAEGKIQLIAKVEEIWKQDDEAGDYMSPVLTDPTWLDIALAADIMIKTTSDYHHRFLEGINKIGRTDFGVDVYQFLMGS